MTAEDFANQVAATFGARPRRHGGEYRVFCPHHEADGGMHKPSLAIWDKGGGRFAFKCMTGCSSASVRSALKGRGISVPGSGPRTAEQQLAAAKANEERRVQSLRRAYECLEVAEKIEVQDCAGRYLASRGITTVWNRNAFGSVLVAPDPNSTGPSASHCLLGIICDLSTLHNKPVRATGIMTLSLNNDGTPRLVGGQKFRSIVGTQKGFGIPFGKIGPHMVVAEGLEMAISALEIIGADFCVATLSASNMPSLVIPEWVRRVSIAVDNDEAGANAAHRLELSLQDLFRVDIWRWNDAEGWDANDELMKRKGLK